MSELRRHMMMQQGGVYLSSIRTNINGSVSIIFPREVPANSTVEFSFYGIIHDVQFWQSIFSAVNTGLINQTVLLQRHDLQSNEFRISINNNGLVDDFYFALSPAGNIIDYYAKITSGSSYYYTLNGNTNSRTTSLATGFCDTIRLFGGDVTVARAKAYLNGNLFFDMRPYMKNGEIGFIDLYDGQFYTNSLFTVGAL